MHVAVTKSFLGYEIAITGVGGLDAWNSSTIRGHRGAKALQIGGNGTLDREIKISSVGVLVPRP